MAKSRVSGAKKKIGRPRIDATPVNTRFPPEELRALDAWISRQASEVSRPEAVRRLVEQGLKDSAEPTIASRQPSRRRLLEQALSNQPKRRK
jgi:hypothetical protein